MTRRRATLLWAAFSALGALFGVSTKAEAQEQPWLRDRRYTDGTGVGVGDFVFHPGIAAEFGYDSNILLRSGDGLPGIDSPRVEALRLQITPHVQFNNRLPAAEGLNGNAAQPRRPTYSLNGNVALSYNEFFQLNGEAEDLPRHRNLGILAGLQFVLAPYGKLGAEVHGDLVRTIQPSNLGDPSATFNRTTPRIGGSVIWRPGGGLFEWNVLGYDFAYTFFEDQPFDNLSNAYHQVFTRGSWRFRPRTAFVFDSSLGFYRYGANTERPDGDLVRARIGLNGLLTNVVGFTLLGGWGSTFFDTKAGPVQDFDSFIGQAEVRFYLSNPPRDAADDGSFGAPTRPGVYPSTIALGYTRDFNQSYISNFYQRDRGYVTLSYFLNGQILTSLSGGVARNSFPDSFHADNRAPTPAFVATSFDLTAFGEYRVTPNFGVHLTGMFQRFDTDQRLNITPDDDGDGNPATVPAPVFDDLWWDRVQIMLGLRYLLLASRARPPPASPPGRRRALRARARGLRSLRRAPASRWRAAAAHRVVHARAGRPLRARHRRRREAAERVHRRPRRLGRPAMDRPAEGRRARAARDLGPGGRRTRQAGVPSRAERGGQRQRVRLEARAHRRPGQQAGRHTLLARALALPAHHQRRRLHPVGQP